MKKVFWKVEHQDTGIKTLYSQSECKKSTTAIKRFCKVYGYNPDDCKIEKVTA